MPLSDRIHGCQRQKLPSCIHWTAFQHSVRQMALVCMPQHRPRSVSNTAKQVMWHFATWQQFRGVEPPQTVVEEQIEFRRLRRLEQLDAAVSRELLHPSTKVRAMQSWHCRHRGPAVDWLFGTLDYGAAP